MMMRHSEPTVPVDVLPPLSLPRPTDREAVTALIGAVLVWNPDPRTDAVDLVPRVFSAILEAVVELRNELETRRQVLPETNEANIHARRTVDQAALCINRLASVQTPHLSEIRQLACMTRKLFRVLDRVGEATGAAQISALRSLVSRSRTGAAA